MSFFDKALSYLEQASGLDALWAFVTKKFPVINKLLDLAKKVIEHFTGTFDAAWKLFQTFESEIAAWKHFKEDFRFRQRVIQVERAIQKTRDLVQGLIEAWKNIISLLKGVSFKLEAGGAAEIAEAATGIGLPIAVVNAIVIVVEVLDTIRNVIDEFQSIIDEVTRIREFLQGDVVFLNQRNPRKVLTLEDGTKIKIRVGGLHPA
jgi:uncharacterized membrane protein YccF (DUF307 family)